MIKKFENFNRNNLRKRLEDLRFFLPDRTGMDMISVIGKLTSELSTSRNYNDEYQLPLSILYKTGKFPDIKKNGDSYYTELLDNKSLVLNADGDWDPVNKLNTNYSDLADLLYDIFDHLSLVDELNYMNDVDLKDWLLKFSKKEDIYKIIKDLDIDISKYTEHNRKFSKIGEEAENKVANIIKSKGIDILYQGGDGDYVDMIYGADIIAGKNDKIYLIQVKSAQSAAKTAFDKAAGGKGNYRKIDWFCAPYQGGVIIYTKGNPSGKIVK